MLKRIKEIRNVGRFQNCLAGSTELDELTLVYGRNTYGKSTFADVFASLEENHADRLSSRYSIPSEGGPQRVELSFAPPGASKEQSAVYSQGAWTHGLPADLILRTFDDGFIHRNVFVARQFNRETKENFSSFVLGARGVEQAKAIAEKKRERDNAARERSQLERDAFKGVDDIQAFVNLSPAAALPDTPARLQRLRDEHTSLRKQQDQVGAIHQRQEGAVLQWRHNVSGALGRINETLGLDLQSAHETAKLKVDRHIENTFANPVGAEQWIREGLQNVKSDECQFCGQPLGSGAQELLELYREAFDSAFDDHDREVKSKLDGLFEELRRSSSSDLRLELASNRALTSAYPEIRESDADYRAALAEKEEVEADLSAALDRFDEEIRHVIRRVQESIGLKKGMPHKALEVVSEESIIALEDSIRTLVERYNGVVNALNTHIRAFKASVSSDSLEARLKKLDHLIAEAESVSRRIELQEQCDHWSALQGRIVELEKEVAELEKQLDEGQSEYLDAFFGSLDGWFRSFGSQDFVLERGETKRGHTPIYFVKVRYKGKPIRESEISCVFSESDRRALALAVFWAQLKSLHEDELARCIVVLDDPVTSFDDNRVSAVHRELADLQQHVRQVVVLSHYRYDIEMQLKGFGRSGAAKLLCLTNSSTAGTTIEPGDPREFCLSAHERVSEKLRSFACGQIDDHSIQDLRIFLESELDSRFAAQMADLGLSELCLSDRIEGLFEGDVISEAVRAECHRWRLALNPAHHDWMNVDLEDARQTVRDFLSFVYDRLVRAQI